MFQLTINDAINMAEPDVCYTPMGVPTAIVSVPYINISKTSSAEDTIDTILIDGNASLNLMSSISSSEGNEEGIYGGIISHVNMGATRYIFGSTVLFLKGSPSIMVSSPTGQNGETMNVVGSCTKPSQTIVDVKR